MSSLKSRVEAEVNGINPEEITELNLDNSRATEIEGLTNAFVNLETLSLNNICLQSLKGLPFLPSLKKLELCDNRLTGSLDLLVQQCPNLEQLALSGNRIKDIETIAPLATLKKLHTLEMYNCAVSSTDTYRDEVFAMLPTLKYLDGFDKNQCEIPEDDEEDPDTSYEEGDEEENGEESDEEYVPTEDAANGNNAPRADLVNGVDSEGDEEDDEDDAEFEEEEDDEEWEGEGEANDASEGDGEEELEDYEEEYIEEASNDAKVIPPNRGTKRSHETEPADSESPSKVYKNGE